MKSIKNKINNFADQIQNELEQQNKNKENMKQPNNIPRRNSHSTSNPEQVIGTMWSYFFAFWLGLFMSLFAVTIFLTNQKTLFLAVLIIVAIPFWCIFCFVMMIPDVKIFGYTIFSRRSLSIRKSVSLGRRIIYAFSKEFYRQNPGMATMLFLYLILIIVAVFYAVT